MREASTFMNDFEEALRNIDVFCKVLVKKMIEDENEAESKIVVEPIENLQRKYVIEEHLESNPLAKHLIPLPQVEEPLIDIFEGDNYVKVLVQCRCKEQKVSIHADIDGVQMCRKECHNDVDSSQVCVDKCQKLNLPVKHLQIENITAKCNNNSVFEVDIPKK